MTKKWAISSTTTTDDRQFFEGGETKHTNARHQPRRRPHHRKRCRHDARQRSLQRRHQAVFDSIDVIRVVQRLRVREARPGLAKAVLAHQSSRVLRVPIGTREAHISALPVGALTGSRGARAGRRCFHRSHAGPPKASFKPRRGSPPHSLHMCRQHMDGCREGVGRHQQHGEDRSKPEIPIGISFQRRAVEIFCRRKATAKVLTPEVSKRCRRSECSSTWWPIGGGIAQTGVRARGSFGRHTGAAAPHQEPAPCQNTNAWPFENAPQSRS